MIFLYDDTIIIKSIDFSRLLSKAKIKFVYHK